MKTKLFTLLVLASALFTGPSYGMDELKEFDQRFELKEPKYQRGEKSLFEFLQDAGYTVLNPPIKIGHNDYSKNFMYILQDIKVSETGDKNLNFNFYNAVHTLYNCRTIFNPLFKEDNKSFIPAWFKYTTAFGLGIAAVKAFHYFKVSDYLSTLPFIGKK